MGPQADFESNDAKKHALKVWLWYEKRLASTFFGPWPLYYLLLDIFLTKKLQSISWFIVINSETVAGRSALKTSDKTFN